MATRLLMGNEAIALGAIRAGVNLASGYPGTPSTEILENLAKYNPGDIHVEWSVNEKAALEVAAGASYSGARTLVTMKQVGLNVASDPLMSLNYVGIKGGMVIVVADDPGPISSQTEQDTRRFGKFAKMMVFDPSSPKEAYEMVQEAFDFSEKYGKPVFLRPTTRVDHGYQTIDALPREKTHEFEGFVKDSLRWVIFPRSSYLNHIKLEKMMTELSDVFSDYHLNTVTGSGKKGIATGGISYEYVSEVLDGRGDVKVMKVSTPHPFPEKKALEFLSGLDEVLVCEELDPVIEQELMYICGKYSLHVRIRGKLTGDVANAGENTVNALAVSIAKFLNEPVPEVKTAEDMPELPVRPPVLCAGCPHRASFYAVKRAMKEAGIKSNFTGDIGCYTLGNAKPLDMCDTCLCMGADITIAQGLHWMNPDARNFAFIGDSTFFASGITGIVNAVYNKADMTLIVLDNSTTAMTGHQPHPGTGRTIMGDITEKISIEKVLKAIGVDPVVTADPLKLEDAVKAVKKASEGSGVHAVIMKSPCIAVTKPSKPVTIDKKKCIECRKCISEIGCPAIVINDGKVGIDESLCFGCGLCEHICPAKAIKDGGKRI